MTFICRIIQRSPSSLNLRIHIRSSSDVLFDSFNVSQHSSKMNRIFRTTFSAVFAEEVGDFGMFATDGPIQRCCFAKFILRIHIRTFGNE